MVLALFQPALDQSLTERQVNKNDALVHSQPGAIRTLQGGAGEDAVFFAFQRLLNQSTQPVKSRCSIAIR